MVSNAIKTHINGRYILQEKLGEGGMGAVYRATDRLTGETVALKQVILPAQQLEQSPLLAPTGHGHVVS